MKVRLIGKNLADIRPLLSRYGLQEAGDTEISPKGTIRALCQPFSRSKSIINM